MILSWFRYELYFNVHIFLLTVTYVTRTPLGYGPHLGDVCCLGAGQVVNSFKIHKISSVVAAHFTNSGQWARPAAQARLVRSPRHGNRGDLNLGSGETYLWHISNTFCSLQTHETNRACRQFKVISFAQASPLHTPCPEYANLQVAAYWCLLSAFIVTVGLCKSFYAWCLSPNQSFARLNTYHIQSKRHTLHFDINYVPLTHNVAHTLASRCPELLLCCWT